ncbi:patatin-like phospholipase family protein [Bacillus sp. CGMCC 1.16607]|uniref:patatin-like phospholipase family protein n=1 Tax=Bacillus sp. CGMCC 1.16607 TaxID=3351842 RepID=UPI00362624E3
MEIDGVFSGGGVKGLALIGAVCAIEKKGFTFKRVAGTSAGSIIAALIAAGYKSKEMFAMMDELNLTSFLDARRTLIPSAIAKWFLLYWRLGLYKGNELEAWIESKLAVRGIRTFSDIPPNTLRVIASDLTNGRLVVLPDDLPKYGVPIQSFSIAKAIRMSCSLPYFFEPVKLRTLEGNNIIVDGGVLSNFPMWLFDKENVKKERPVLGIKLSHGEQNQQPKNKINNAIQMFEALFETMKDAHDARYISRKHEKNIIFIPTEGILTTEFQLTDERKQTLFDLGEKQANQFFNRWSY